MKASIIMIVLLLSLPLTKSDTNNTNETNSITQAINTAKLGCPSKCGNVTIPYPFGIGIGSGCSVNPRFDINCTSAFGPPKPIMRGLGEIEIFNISDSTMRIANFVSWRCYNATKNGYSMGDQWMNLGFGNGPFTISEENTFYVIGCSSYGLLNVQNKLRKGLTGCLAFCSGLEEVTNGTCSGSGCCQTLLPKDIYYYNTSYITFNGSTRSISPCTYSFVGEKDVFKFKGASDLNDPTFTTRVKDAVPRVLEWAIGNISCAQAKGGSRTDYVCQTNSYCVDSKRISGGYRCRCNEGYDGNPYLQPGCQDVNECEDRNKYTCYGVCVNTPGSYNCTCPHGHIGDPRIKNGCIPAHKNSKLWVSLFSLGVVIGVGLLVSSLWLLKVVQRRKIKKQKEYFFKRNGGLLLQQQISSGEGIVDQQIRLFNATELEKATGQFNDDRVLGRGGQGAVYKGMLGDGRIVAVKKAISVDESQIKTFINEVFILSQIIHKNIVKLLGCCLETEVPMLVYEFIPNGTLFEFIHDENYEFPSVWKMRLQIATEIAGGLAYLHSATNIPVFHRDIKSANILLDDKFRAKLSDFGISKSVSGDQTHLSTMVKGTMGYLDPEYFQSSHLTEKSDVYSFGVVLLELLTGKKPVFRTDSEESMGLAMFVLSMEDEQIVENVDDRIKDASEEEIVAVANLAKRCLNLNGMLRPNMKDVAIELEGVRTIR